MLASGITIVQVVANPLISMLGSPATAPSRLTFAQAFNSLGTTIFPYVGSTLILGSLSSVDQSKLVDGALLAFRAQESSVVAETYLGLAVILAIGAVLVWLGRNRLVEAPAELVAEPTTIMRAFDLLARPRFGFGALAIFLYVGAEVSVGSVLASWLMRADTLGLVAERAGKMVALYWGGAMIGRFVGAAVLRRVSPPLALAGVAVAASVLLVAAGASDGAIAGWSMIAIGLCNSIMFPTIFSLASTGLGRRAAEGSGIICMAIVGGAVVPLITGAVADAEGLRLALGVPMLCYLVIACFAFACLRLAVPADDPVPVTAA